MLTYSYTILWYLYTPTKFTNKYYNFGFWAEYLSKILWVLSNRDVRKWDHSYNNNEKLGQSYTFSQKKGAYRLPSSAEKGGYSRRTSVLCHIKVVTPWAFDGSFASSGLRKRVNTWSSFAGMLFCCKKLSVKLLSELRNQDMISVQYNVNNLLP